VSELLDEVFNSHVVDTILQIFDEPDLISIVVFSVFPIWIFVVPCEMEVSVLTKAISDFDKSGLL